MELLIKYKGQLLSSHAPRSGLVISHGHRHTIPGDGISNEPGLYVSQHDSEIGDGMNIPCQGRSTEGRFSRHALVATMPLNNNRWDPLKAGEIACFERGERIR